MDLFDHSARTAMPFGVPPDVCVLFESLALKIAAQHWRRYSADAILHRIRWEMQIERGQRAFKCNNNWTAPLARWFMAVHPEMVGFFELRERVTDGYSEEAA